MGKKNQISIETESGFKLTCKRATELLIDYVTNALHPEDKRLFEDHLRGCADCMAFLNTYKETVKLTKSLDYEDIPPDVRAALHETLRRNIPGIR